MRYVVVAWMVLTLSTPIMAHANETGQYGHHMHHAAPATWHTPTAAIATILALAVIGLIVLNTDTGENT